MKLLVTGGAGFIGSNFIRYWLTQHPDDHIVNLDALTYAGNLKSLEDIDPSKHTFIKGNICDAETVHRAMDGVDVVVHFAAESHVDRSITGPAAFIQTNVIGTHILLEEALKQKQLTRFHHVSTDEVFGSLALDAKKSFDEETPYNPRSPYSASKAGSDHLVRAYFHTYGLPITISNCSNNYGPYHFPEKFIPHMIVRAMQDQSLPIYGDGKNVRDWIHVLDHARGIEAILDRGKVGETYCLGGNAEPANIEVAKKILETLGKPKTLLMFVEDRKGHDRRYSIDFSKAKRELGWSPQIEFETGLRETIQWFQDHESWWRPLLTE